MTLKRKYQELKVWQRAMDLVTRIYGATAVLPDTEKFGLVTQLQRAAVSIPSNIAEGAGRNSPKDFLYFLCSPRLAARSGNTTTDWAAVEYAALTDEIVDDIEAVFAMLSKMMERLRNSK